MKLTEEQKKEFNEGFWRYFGTPKLRAEGMVLALQDFIDKYFPQPTEEPNTSRWYHCSERLPTEEDTDSQGDVARLDANRELHITNYLGFTKDAHCWWTPSPKNLVKPTPPDPFEELWKEATTSFGPFPSVFLENDVKNAMKKAYELGLSQPKQ